MMMMQRVRATNTSKQITAGLF